MKTQRLHFLSERALFKHTASLQQNSEQWKEFPVEHLIPVEDESEATLVSSAIDGDDPWPGEQPLHLPVLDIDFPAHLEPSTTLGHFHLYLDKEVEWDKYVAFLEAAKNADILEAGFVNASIKRKATYVRYPGVVKGVDKPVQQVADTWAPNASSIHIAIALRAEAERTGTPPQLIAILREAADRLEAIDKINNPDAALVLKVPGP
jgi:hypothetical protein